MIRALLAERANHERHGRRRHVALVDDELAKLGHRVERPAETPEKPAQVETTTESAPREDAAEPRGSDHVCEDCGRTFRTAAALGSHRRSHSE